MLTARYTRGTRARGTRTLGRLAHRFGGRPGLVVPPWAVASLTCACTANLYGEACTPALAAVHDAAQT